MFCDVESERFEFCPSSFSFSTSVCVSLFETKRVAVQTEQFEDVEGREQLGVVRVREDVAVPDRGDLGCK